MAVEIKIGDRVAWANLLKQDGNILEVEVDGKIYNVDLMHTADGTFSILENGHSYDIELVPDETPKKYTAYTLYERYDVEVIDAEARYLQNRNANGAGPGDNKITSPMPGKVVKVMVEEGDTVKEGDTIIIISAMKMESEYKAPKDGTVKKVNVKNQDTVDSNQVLIELD
ncbi:biotin/lipoyl-containing protein [Draconibacterium halophilum]|uniref:Biotin/lipoyl-binding protein n=1 Tax=Draconibacterium halophilum TaxID=2706887 RepID=A0A6C0RE09_9BACT|nr:biotin/lipoyl-containing protein [Draconibacterium halophilum]QIA08112.1 biotin/lipoyl-binding protein [Draconibacterium halophilum]